MLPPPIPSSAPKWVTEIGAKLKTDAGGKYYEIDYTVTQKVYVDPVFRVEQTNAYVHRPRGYVGKKKSRKDNAVSSVPKTKKKVTKVVRTEEW